MRGISNLYSLSVNFVSPIIEPEPTTKKKRRMSPSAALLRKIELANEGINL